MPTATVFEQRNFRRVASPEDLFSAQVKEVSPDVRHDDGTVAQRLKDVSAVLGREPTMVYKYSRSKNRGVVRLAHVRSEAADEIDMAPKLQPLSVEHGRGRRRQAHHDVSARDTRLEIIRHLKINGQKMLFYQLLCATSIPVPHVNPFDGRANCMHVGQMGTGLSAGAEHDQFRRVDRGEVARRKRGISCGLASGKTFSHYERPEAPIQPVDQCKRGMNRR